MHVRVISGRGGGPEKTILNSPRFLAPLGYRSLCVYLRDPIDSGFEIIQRRAKEKNAPLVPIDDFGLKDFRIVSRLREVIQQYQPAIFHGHDYKSNLLGLMVRRQHPMKLITTVHGWVQRTWKTPLYFFVDKQCLRRYDHVVCVSRDLHDDCQRLCIPEHRLSLIDNAIALDDYQVKLSQAEAKKTLGFPVDEPLLAAVGRLSDEKAFDRLIDAANQLQQSGLKLNLAIAGEGASAEKLQRQIEQLGAGNRIRLLGFVADPRNVYRAADLYVLSSLREGLPNVVLEAMTMNVPVLSTHIAGMPDLIEHGVNGWLVEPGSTGAIREGIDSLINDPSKREQLAVAGRQTIEARFSFQLRMQRITELYNQLGVPGVAAC